MFIDDIRHAFRRLRSQPGAAAGMVVLLASGIGLTTAMFTVIDTLVLRPVPFPHADRLARVSMLSNRGGRVAVHPSVLGAWRGSPAFEAVAGFAPDIALVETDAGLQARDRAIVSTGLFEMLDVRAIRGRLFLPDEGKPGTADRVVISETVWRSAFNADPGILNRRVLINGVNATVVGIVPASFRFPNWNTTIWMPVDFRSPPAELSATLPQAVVRLSEGMPVADAMRIAADAAHAADAATLNLFAQPNPLAGAPANDYVHRAAPFLTGGVALVFIVICANASSLLLARLTARSREFSVSAALGASRARLIRETMIESFILGLISVGAGLGVAAVLVMIGRAFLPEAFLARTLNPMELDFRAFAVASVTGVAGAFAAALLPAWLGTRTAPSSSLRSFDRSSTSSRAVRSAARALLVTEIALACALLVGATLLVRSFLNLSNADRGLEAEGVLTAWVTGLPGSSSNRAAREAASSAVEAAVRSLPGVRSVAMSFGLPPDGGSYHFGDGWQSDVPGAPALNMTVQSYNVGADFFELYGIPVLRGRSFEPGDSPDAVIVGERLANILWPGLEPTGRSFTWENGRYDVIGVAREIHLPTVDTRMDLPEFYRQFSNGAGQFMLSIRCNTACPDPALVRKRIVDAGSDIRVANVGPLEAKYLAQTSRPRAAAALAFTFAAISLLAATGGLFSVLSYAVGQRGREFGIRFALGARPSEVRGLVFRESAAVAGAGLALGGLAAWWISRSLSALTYRVSPGDASTWIFVAAVIGVTVLLASWRPAAQASRVNPVILLREE